MRARTRLSPTGWLAVGLAAVWLAGIMALVNVARGDVPGIRFGNITRTVDSLALPASWSPSCDSLGCADAYAVEWTRSGRTVRADTIPSASDTLTFAAPTTDVTLCVEVIAVRRGLASDPRSTCHTLALADVPPPPVDSLRVDSAVVIDTTPVIDTAPTKDTLPDIDSLPPVVDTTPLPVDTSPVVPFFSDDFETGDFAAETPLFRWSKDNRTRVDADTPAHSGQFALRFRYAGTDSLGDAMAEQRFRFGDSTMTEVWAEWWVKLPANWTLRNDAGPGNNKFFVLWNKVYSGDNVQVTAQYNRCGDLCGAVNVVGRDGMRSGYHTYEPVFGPAQVGRWTRLRFHARVASSATAEDGLFEVVRDTTLVHRYLGEWWKPNAADRTLLQGYILGWANTGFTEETHIYVDDVKFYDRDPAWQKMIAAGTVQPVASAPTTYANSEKVDHTFSHTRTAADQDVLIAVYGIGYTGTSGLDVTYAGLPAEVVAARAMTGKSNVVAWFRVRAPRLGSLTGAADVSLKLGGSPRGAHIQAFNVSNVGAITSVGGGSATATTLTLPTLAANAGDLLLGAFISQGDGTVSPTDAAQSGASISDEGSPTRGAPERRMVTVAEPLAGPRTVAATVTLGGIPVTGLALRITGVRIHP